jgi:hypothetical protein
VAKISGGMAQRFGIPLIEFASVDVDELAVLVVEYPRREVANGRKPHVGNALNDVHIEAGESGLSQNDERQAQARLAEAWQWMRNHLLLIPGEGFWEALGPAADFVTVPGYLLETRAKDLLGGLTIDEQLRHETEGSFRRGSYAAAVLAAFRLVEARVRDAGRLPRGVVTQKVMFAAFNPGGPLADPQLLDSENQGRAQLFAGAIAAIKNEHSHRIVNIDDPQEAAELVLFANMLLRILARATAAVHLTDEERQDS